MSVTTSILIATRNRPALLRECLESLLRCGLEDAEVLVLDQSADGQSEALVRELGGDRLRYTRLPVPGKSRALNAGIAMARGARIALTDDDCVVAEDWLRAMDQAFRETGDERRVVICGRVLPGRHAPDGEPPPSCISDPEPRRWAGRVGRDVVYQNWAVRRTAFDEVGVFDERLGPGGVLRNAEDNDMAYRWLRAGYEVLYRPEIVVQHNGWRRREELYALKWDYGVGQGAFYAKHFCRGDGHLAGRFVKDSLRIARDAVTSLVKADLHSARGNATFLTGLWAGAVRMALISGRAGPSRGATPAPPSR